jgi:hypothetical protein
MLPLVAQLGRILWLPAEYTHRFWEAMIVRGIAVGVIERAGGYAFEDYVSNGSALQAFAAWSCLVDNWV